MNHPFAGQVVVVTGASKGIGFACAEAFARGGAKVALVSRSKENLDAAMARLQGIADTALAIVADLRNADEAARMVADVEARLGPIDVLVNSAGAAKRHAPADLSAKAWRDAMDAKFFSYIHPTDLVVKRMAARGHGAIVNIIGMGGKVANPIHLPGGAANAALMLATAGLAAAYGPMGVRINAVSPGGTLTGRVQEGRGRAGRAFPRLERGELRHGRDHPDGRRQQRRHLNCRRRSRTNHVAAAPKAALPASSSIASSHAAAASPAPRPRSSTQPTRGCRIPAPRKMPRLTTEVAIPECSGRLTSLATAHESVKPGMSSPM